MVISTVHEVDVHRYSCIECKRTEKFLRQAEIILSAGLVYKFSIENQKRTVLISRLVIANDSSIGMYAVP